MAVWTTKITPTITAGLYGAEDGIGGVIEIVGAPSSGIIETWMVQDDGDQAVILELFFCESEPAGVADNAPHATVSDADMQLVMGYLITGTYQGNADSNFFYEGNAGLAYQTTGGSIWLMIRTPGTPTYVATDDLTFRFSIVY